MSERRGVVPGDVMRASNLVNERFEALGEGHELDMNTAGWPAELPAGSKNAVAGDLFDGGDAKQVTGDLVYSYTSMSHGTVFDVAQSMVGHALMIGVLTERQRYDGAGISVEAARLGAILPRLTELAECVSAMTVAVQEENKDAIEVAAACVVTVCDELLALGAVG